MKKQRKLKRENKSKFEYNTLAWLWWNRLSEKEQNLILTKLYDIDLNLIGIDSNDEEYVDVEMKE